MNPWKKRAIHPEAQQPFRIMEKILIVEDDQAVQKVLKRLFESAGYAVKIIGDGQTALEAFRSTTPTAIVLDLHLLVLSGKDVVQIRQQRNLSQSQPDHESLAVECQSRAT